MHLRKEVYNQPVAELRSGGDQQVQHTGTRVRASVVVPTGEVNQGRAAVGSGGNRQGTAMERWVGRWRRPTKTTAGVSVAGANRAPARTSTAGREQGASPPQEEEVLLAYSVESVST
jgi:hypothetical protein